MLQFITHCNERYDYLSGAIEALKGGCKWIQLRMKEASPDDVSAVVAQLKPLCAEYNAILLLDDYVELVAELNVDGVHLGKNDMPPAQARQLLGEQYIIGGTANTFDDVLRLVNEGVDYIGVGPYRYTATKQNLSPILGQEGYCNIVAQCQAHNITTPIVAIGGIEGSDLVPLMATGISGVALSGTILRADNPAHTTQTIIETLNHIKNEW